jgi:hypothetical protein
MKRAKKARRSTSLLSQCIEKPAAHSGSVTKNCAPMNLDMELGSDGVCDDVWGVFSNWSVVAQSHTFWIRNVQLGRFTSIRGSERSTDEMFTSRRGERRWPMPRLPNNPDRDFSASQSEDDINANIAEFFASRPLGIVELFADPIVRMRLGSLIGEAMNRPTEVAAQSQAR